MCEEVSEPKKKKHISTTRLILGSFLCAIAIGTILLSLPAASAAGKHTSILDAMFTAVTSVCVTGLVVVDTCTQWSMFGQIVILVLIQLGGLGIISFTTLLFLLVGKKITLKDQVLIMDAFNLSTLNLSTLNGLLKFLIKIMKGTLLIEGIGACCYATVFVPEYGGKGLWFSVFHAVSAFCNAGIDIISPDSLGKYVHNVPINVITMVLIILGGIGFIVWWDVLDVLKRVFHKEVLLSDVWKRLQVHSKLVIVMTISLLFGGALLIFILEYHNPETIGNDTLSQKMLASLFQSVTTRTAGFVTFSQKGLTDAGAFVCMLLMFIGGSPVGTAGGIKTTTMAVAGMEAWSMIRGREQAVVYKRSIPRETIRKGIMIICIAVLALVIAVILLLTLQGGDFLDVVFEVTSALGTAGISRDYTATMHTAGKIIIMMCMYLGRVGPASLVIALKIEKDKLVGKYKEETITVG